jgi:hypothetical protein
MYPVCDKFFVRRPNEMKRLALCNIFGRTWVLISVQGTDIQTQVFYDFTQPLQATAGTVGLP